MNRFEVFNNCKARIKNQLRIHWHWLRKEENYKEVFQFIESCMNQAIKKDGQSKKREKSVFCEKSLENTKYFHCKKLPKQNKSEVKNEKL